METDAAILTKYCCGANMLKEGSDPELKPDSEYPDWLWTLDLEPNQQTLTDTDGESFKYWRKIRTEFMKRNNALAKIQFK